MIIPAAALLQHTAILGKTGSGKTFTAKGIVEDALDAGEQVCVLDPTAAWSGLRSDVKGGPGGFNVILIGGERGDIPLSPDSGSAVARLITEQGASVVIDLSGMTVGEYTKWFIDFAGTLFSTLRSPLRLVIDEAHYFMPQGRVPDPQAGKMLHAGCRLMSGGRSRGIRAVMITQRPAKLHKDALTCADTQFAMLHELFASAGGMRPETLGERVDKSPTSSTFKQHVRDLRSLDLVRTKPGDRSVLICNRAMIDPSKDR